MNEKTMSETSTIYICTVGTGTAGRYSDLPQGLVNAITQQAPTRVLLVPSKSGDSVATAELVAEQLRNQCLAASVGPPFSNFDDLARCRREMGRLLRQEHAEDPAARIVLNATSGTKQMTIAAVLAGIQYGADDLEFITGERVDGVVKTGTEQLTCISGRQIRAEQTARDAIRLVSAGAYPGAARILEPYADLFPKSVASTRTLEQWHRQDYGSAYQAAGQAAIPDATRVRKVLADLRESGSVSLLRSADLLTHALRDLEHGFPEESLATVYRAAESMTKHLLQSAYHIEPEYPHKEAILGNPELPLSNRVRRELNARAEQDGRVSLGLHLTLKILNCTNAPFVDNVYRRGPLWGQLKARNRTRFGHGTETVPPDEAAHVLDGLREAALEQWPDFGDMLTRVQFPDIRPTIAEEIEHGQW